MRKGSAIIISLLLSLCACKNKPSQSTASTQRPLIACMPVTADTAWYNSGKKAPLLNGLKAVHFAISTDNELAQRYFDQGLALAYGFNHAEAARSFYYATQLDPECAMCYWGFAYVLGPNYNGGMEKDNYERAYKAIQKAAQVSDKVTAKEKALILAMTKRYSKKITDDRTPLDRAYAEAMKNVFLHFPQAAHIGALYAESLMDLHPWDLWTKEGKPKAWTKEILNTLNKVLAFEPEHVGANHFYIHTVEASGHPEWGYKSARLFDEGLVPGAGHLIHMPSHIYIRTGDYHKGSLANINAIKADSSYITACHAQGVYPLAYVPHNYHFLAATATLAGNSEHAIDAAEKVAGNISIPLMKQPGWGTLQHYYIIPYYVYVKFGKWDKILSLKSIDSSLKYPSAIFHYARGMACLGKRDKAHARQELARLERISEDTSLKEITIWEINTTCDLVQIAKRVLQGELLAAEENFDESIALLKAAVALEDKLNYNEPPDWFFSVRHHLGAVLLEAGLPKDAELIYRDDLENYPKNGWSLFGLWQSLKAQGSKMEAAEIKEDFKNAWKYADIELSSSRIL